MRGHLREVRPGVWQVSWDLPPDPVTGRRRRRSQTVYGDRGEGERQRAIILGRAAAGELGDPGTLTVRELADEWLQLVEGTVRPSTLQSYREKIGLVCRLIGGRRVRDLGPRMLTRLYGQMGRSPQTVVHAHRVLHRMFRDAQRWGIVSSNPCDGAVPPRVARPQLRVWSAAEVQQFLSRVEGHPCGVLFRLALTTGMRRGELVGLRWEQVDVERGLLRVEGSTVMVAGRPSRSEPKTPAARRRIALDPETVGQLVRLRAEQTVQHDFWGGAYVEGWVFCWEDGRPFSPDWVSRQFRGLSWGLPPIRFHDLRHTWATLALEAGVPAKVVADRLGHAGIQITLDTYTHHSEALDRLAAEQVAESFTRDVPRDGSRDTSGSPDVL